MEPRAPVPQQRWDETPMAFEPPPARVPQAMPSITPVEMDMVAQPPARTSDVLAWLPLASIASVGVAVAALLFAVAFTSFSKQQSATNASAGATITSVLPAAVMVTEQPRMPVIQPSVSEPSDEPRAVAPATIAPKTVAPATIAPKTVAPATIAPKTTAPATIAPKTVLPVAPPVARTDRMDRSVIIPAEQPAKKTAPPRVDDEAASAQKMLEEAQRETAGAL